MNAATPFVDMLLQRQAASGSLLCVGLDPEPARFPAPWRGDGQRLFDFCAAIVEATAEFACAFKPQIAYFAARRAEDQLERLIAQIRRVAPGVPVVLDAKRGDIGATAEQYAAEAFVRYGADAVTLSPYMGFDSIEPYLRHRGKGAFLLCRTSNSGGADLQEQVLGGGELLFERVARLAQTQWNHHGQLGLVVGATVPREIERVRALAPALPLLIPGVGAQGGDAATAVRAGMGTGTGTVLVNSSRAILYAGAAAADSAGSLADAVRAMAQAARQAALDTRLALNSGLQK
jgi:orotidine-5'-phosphate decarboxylase